MSKCGTVKVNTGSNDQKIQDLEKEVEDLRKFWAKSSMLMICFKDSPIPYKRCLYESWKSLRRK